MFAYVCAWIYMPTYILTYPNTYILKNYIACMHTFSHTCIHSYTFTSVHIYTLYIFAYKKQRMCQSTYMYIQIRICTCIGIDAYMRVCIYIYIYMYVCVSTHIHIYTHTYTRLNRCLHLDTLPKLVGWTLDEVPVPARPLLQRMP